MWTHWGWVTNICISKLTITGSDNGLSPGRRQAIIWTNAVNWTLGLQWNLNRNSYFHWRKCIWKCLENAGHFVSTSMWWLTTCYLCYFSQGLVRTSVCTSTYYRALTVYLGINILTTWALGLQPSNKMYQFLSQSDLRFHKVLASAKQHWIHCTLDISPICSLVFFRSATCENLLQHQIPRISVFSPTFTQISVFLCRNNTKITTNFSIWLKFHKNFLNI